MARRGEVELVIRAKDAATSAVDSVTKAINRLISTQDDLGKSAGKSDTALDRLRASLSGLDKELKGITVNAQIGRALDAGTKAADRLNASVEKTKAELADLTAKQDAAVASTARLASEMKAASVAADKEAAALERAKRAVADQTGSLRQATADRNQLVAADARLTEQIDAQKGKLSALQTKYAALAAEIAKVAQPTATMVNKLAAVDTAGTKAAAKLADLEQTQAGVRIGMEQTAQAVSRFAGQLEQANGAFARQEAVLAGARAAYTELQAAARIAAQQEKALDGAASNTADGLARQEAALERARVELLQLTVAAGKADAALIQLASGSAAKLQQSFDAQRRSMLETKREWKESEAAVKTLADSMVKIGPPIRSQAVAWQQATIAARAAKAEYQLQKVALLELGAILKETGGDVDVLSQREARFSTVQATVGEALAKVRTEAAAAVVEFQKLARVSQTSIRTPAPARPSGGGGGVADVPDPGRVDRLSDAYRRLYGETRLAMSWTQRLRGEVLSLIAAYGGIFGVITLLGQVIESYRTLEAVTSRLNVVFGGNLAATTQELDFLRRNADRLGISFGALADEYGKFAVATQGTNLEGEKTRKIFLAVAEAGRVNKLSTENMKGVFVALTQIVSKGKVQMEELRQQLGDRLPGAVQIMADALHVTTAELFQMTKEGQVSSDALVAFADELERRFGPQLGRALKTTTTEMGRLENNIFQAQIAFGKAGFIKAFTDLLKDLNTTLKSANFQEFIQSLSVAVAALTNTLAFLVRNFKLVVAVVSGFIALKIGPVFIALAASVLRFTGLMVGVRQAIAMSIAAMNGLAFSAGASSAAVSGLALAMRTLLSATGVGLIITAISVGIGLWATSADQATVALTGTTETLDKIKNAFDAAAGSGQKFAEALDKISSAKIRNDLVGLRKALDDMAKPKTILIGKGDFLGKGQFIEAFKQINNLTKSFNTSFISLDHYQKELDKIAASANDPWIDKFISDNLAAATAVDEQRKKILQSEAALALKKDSTDKAAQAALGLGVAEDKAASAIGASEEALKAWNVALEKASNLIPDINDGLAEMAQLADLAAAFKPMAEAARTMSELNGLIEKFNIAAGQIKAGAIDKVVSGDLVDTIAGIESGGNANAKNPNSSATGLGQFIESTWLRLFKEHFPDRAKSMTDETILLLRKESGISRQMIAIYAKENAAILQQAGVATNKAALYLAHFLGPQGAISLLKAPAGTRTQDVLAPGQIAANRNVLEGKTTQQVIDWAAQKVGLSKEELAVSKELSTLDQKRLDDAEKANEKAGEFHLKLADDIDGERVLLSLKDEGILKQEIAKALQEAENKAKEAGTTLSAQERQNIIDITTEKFKEKAATEQIEAAEKRVNDLMTQRDELQKQITLQRTAGDTDGVKKTQEELAGVNSELTKAIDAAIKLNESLGGAGADTSIAKLRTMKLEAAAVGQAGQEAWIDWSRVGQLFASGLTNAFDQFAQAVAEGKNIGEAARDAFLKFASDFLRQVAQMIIQQAILNAMRSFGLGGAGGGLLGSIFHSGGTVGAGGETSRRADPSWWANAPRMHAGAVAGLKRGEVAAILQRNEEVLSTDDPRNILNGGAAAGGGGQSNGETPIAVNNFFNTDSFMASALNSKVGQRAIMNFVRANPRAIKQALADG